VPPNVQTDGEQSELVNATIPRLNLLERRRLKQALSLLRKSAQTPRVPSSSAPQPQQPPPPPQPDSPLALAPSTSAQTHMQMGVSFTLPSPRTQDEREVAQWLDSGKLGHLAHGVLDAGFVKLQIIRDMVRRHADLFVCCP
jgi:hypothetical protein